MSRTFTGRPEFRLSFGYPDIIIERPEAPPQAIALDRGDPDEALRGLACEIARRRGRLTAVLPEAEVWRRASAAPASALRRDAAAALGARPEAIVLARSASRSGLRGVAAVRRATLAEARAFLARAGLKPEAVTAAGPFPGFAAPPGFGARPSLADPRLRAAAGLSGVAAMLAIALWTLPSATPPSTAALDAPAMTEPASLAIAPPPASIPAPAEVALVELAPPPRPADLRPLRAAEPPAPAQRPTGVGMAARNLPEDMRPPTDRVPATPSILTQAEPPRRRPNAAGPLEAMLAPLPRPAPNTALDADAGPNPPAARADGPRPRPAARKSVDPLVATLDAAITATPLTVAPSGAGPRPRPFGSRPAPAEPAVLVAALTPAAAGASLAGPGAALAIALPEPRRLPPRPVVTAPVKVRPAAAPQPARAAPAVQPARPQRVRLAAPPAQPMRAQPAAVRVQPRAAPQPAAQRQPRLGRNALTLVGVFGKADSRHALVQLPSGATQRVRAGDELQGVQVTAIAADAVHLRAQGRSSVLTLPE